MIQTLESTVMDRRIWGQIVEWLQIPEIQVAIFFIVEFGDTFLLEQFYYDPDVPGARVEHASDVFFVTMLQGWVYKTQHNHMKRCMMIV